MNSNYDLIATVNINIESPIVDETSFGNLLIVGPGPSVTPATAPAAVGEYKSLKAVTDAGWAATDPVAVAAKVAFAQTPTPYKIYIAPIQIVTTAADGGGTTSAPEAATATITRALANQDWYVVCTAGVEASEYPAIASLIETQERMFVFTELDFNFTTKVGSVSSSAGLYRTFGIFGKETSTQAAGSVPSENKHLNVAFAAAWLNYQSGSETAAFKELRTVKPSVLTDTEIAGLEEGGINYFTTIGNRNVTMVGKVLAGEWADIIRFRDWLKSDMQVRLANVFVNNAKVPYTDAGIALLHSAMRESLTEGQNRGGIAADEYDEDGNLTPGFETNVPSAASISASQKASRRLTGPQFRARLSGAIHFAEITGSMTYDK